MRAAAKKLALLKAVANRVEAVQSNESLLSGKGIRTLRSIPTSKGSQATSTIIIRAVEAVAAAEVAETVVLAATKTTTTHLVDTRK